MSRLFRSSTRRSSPSARSPSAIIKVLSRISGQDSYRYFVIVEIAEEHTHLFPKEEPAPHGRGVLIAHLMQGLGKHWWTAEEDAAVRVWVFVGDAVKHTVPLDPCRASERR